jgi:nucleotide-binding universal stress UspA family protein
MLKRILWATDASDAADLALPAVEGVAGPLHAEVAVFRMQRPVRPGERVDEEETRAKLGAQIDALERAGCTRAFMAATPGGFEETAHQVADAARRLDVDLIVIGTHGHSGVSGPFLSIVTHRLLHLAQCPVLVVPSQAVSIDAAPLTTAATSHA